MSKIGLAELLRQTPEGESIWSGVKDTAVASYAQRAGVKVKTERYLAVHAPSRTVEEIVKITVLGSEDKPAVKAVGRAERARAVPTPTQTRKPLKTSERRR